MPEPSSQRAPRVTPVTFARVSEALTGVEPLDRALAAEYLVRIRATAQAAALPRLLAVYHDVMVAGGDTSQTITEQILADDELRQLCVVIVLLWYLGELHEPGKPAVGGHPEHYYRGLFWPAVQAHPQGLSGGYFGHWAYRPDN